MTTQKIMALIAGSLLTICTTAQEKIGAEIPWTTVEAEDMKTSGKVIGPKFDAFKIETESSGQKAVKLKKQGESVQFKSPVDANSLVVRYSLPDNNEGTGTNAKLIVKINGKESAVMDIDASLTHLYGLYPFTNTPGERHRNYYDEARVKNLKIKKGDQISISADLESGSAEYCVIDLADLEMIPAPLSAPANAIDFTEFKKPAHPDYTIALREAIDLSEETGKPVWIPAGDYVVAGTIEIMDNVTVQGAGMWHSNLIADKAHYDRADHRIRFFGRGTNITLADFSITGALNYRNDQDWNDGIVGAYGDGSTIKNLWIEHTKIGVWVENSTNMTTTGCRFRNTIADGLNYCIGMRNSTVSNCSTRGTGDDAFAMWPATWMPQNQAPGLNTFTHCTASLPWLANGAAIYGGESNKVEYCSFKDISAGAAVLISTTFPTTSDKVNNNFTGTTRIEHCEITTSGGWDHAWDFRGAIEICLDKQDIAGLSIDNVQLNENISDAITVVTENGGTGKLEKANFSNIEVKKTGLGFEGYGLRVERGVSGDLSINASDMSSTKNNSTEFKIALDEGAVLSK